VRAEEALDLAHDVVEARVLCPEGVTKRVRVHRVAGPDDRDARLAHARDERRQRLAHAARRRGA
jgi:hypothetical protein